MYQKENMHKFGAGKAGDIERELKVKLTKVLGSRKHAFPWNCIDFYESTLLYALGGRAQNQKYIDSVEAVGNRVGYGRSWEKE